MNIYHIDVSMWDGDYWQTVDEAVVVEKTEEAAVARFGWANGRNVGARMLGKAASGIGEGVVLEIYNYALSRVIEEGSTDKRALAITSMLDLYRTKGESMAQKTYTDQELEELVNRILKNLTPSEERILEMRFGIKSSSLQDAVRTVQETQKRVREIETKALRRLVKSKGSKSIDDRLR